MLRESREGERPVYFNADHEVKPDRLLSFAEEFGVAREIRPEVFYEGIHKFSDFANLKYKKRKELFGSFFYGLHYGIHLADKYNEENNSKTTPDDFDSSCPPGWDCVKDGEYFAYVCDSYDNTQAENLDNFIMGPSVIDCGMFCQLSIWFGIKYMLGNKSFNKVFKFDQLLITQFLYNPCQEDSPVKGNPLYDFFKEENDCLGDVINIKHIYSHYLCHLKHPGGIGDGVNCIVINDRYYSFDPRGDLRTLDQAGCNEDDKAICLHFDILSKMLDARLDSHPVAEEEINDSSLEQNNSDSPVSSSDELDVAAEESEALGNPASPEQKEKDIPYGCLSDLFCCTAPIDTDTDTDTDADTCEDCLLGEVK